MKRSLIAATVLAAASLPFAAPAWADNQEDIARLAQTKISLTQAVAAAEKHHPGSQAVQADLDSKMGKVIYEVEVVSADKQVHEVTVDAVTGQVLHSELDRR